MFDLLLRNGLVIDGTGAPPFAADVGIESDQVADVGDLAAAEARRSIDATGLWICPGFIDVHSHSDAYLLIEPAAPSKVAQGITTEVVGNCGASGAPRFGAARMPSDWQRQTYPGRWSTVAEYRALLEQERPAVNVVLLVGHNTLRGSVMGYDARPAGPDDVRRMVGFLERSMEEGAVGFSTGLAYAPGMFAEAEEIHPLARAVVARGGIYATHMRSEGRRLIEAIDETLATAQATGVRTQISHLKTSGPENWHKLDAVLERIARARAEGVEVAADRYPYTASSTDLDAILPDWACEGDRDAIVERLTEPASRARLRAELLAARPDEAAWSRIVVGSTGRADLVALTGHTLTEIARDTGREPVDVALDLMAQDRLATQAFFHGMSEENMWRILAQPWVMLGTDASIRSPVGPLSTDHPHPRAYGTMPRFLRAAIDGRTVPTAEAICKMTSLPAEQFRLRDRGVLRTGAAADIVVLDPMRVRDAADFASPHRLAEGIEIVIVNGAVTMENGRATGRRAGRVLTG